MKRLLGHPEREREREREREGEREREKENVKYHVADFSHIEIGAIRSTAVAENTEVVLARFASVSSTSHAIPESRRSCSGTQGGIEQLCDIPLYDRIGIQIDKLLDIGPIIIQIEPRKVEWALQSKKKNKKNKKNRKI